MGLIRPSVIYQKARPVTSPSISCLRVELNGPHRRQLTRQERNPKPASPTPSPAHSPSPRPPPNHLRWRPAPPPPPPREEKPPRWAARRGRRAEPCPRPRQLPPTTLRWRPTARREVARCRRAAKRGRRTRASPRPAPALRWPLAPPREKARSGNAARRGTTTKRQRQRHGSSPRPPPPPPPPPPLTTHMKAARRSRRAATRHHHVKSRKRMTTTTRRRRPRRISPSHPRRNRRYVRLPPQFLRFIPFVSLTRLSNPFCAALLSHSRPRGHFVKHLVAGGASLLSFNSWAFRQALGVLPYCPLTRGHYCHLSVPNVIQVLSRSVCTIYS